MGPVIEREVVSEYKFVIIHFACLSFKQYVFLQGASCETARESGLFPLGSGFESIFICKLLIYSRENSTR